MEFNYYITNVDRQLNEIAMMKYFKDLLRMADNKIKKVLKQSFDKFYKLLQDYDLEKQFLDIYNRQFPEKKIKSLKRLAVLKEGIIYEDFKNFLRFWKSETYPALAIFPTLQIWFQIDKLLDGAGIKDLDWKKIAIYATMWVIIVGGQHIILHKKWKKENPEQWEEEGRPGIFRSGKKSKYQDSELTPKEIAWAKKHGVDLRRQAD